MTRSESKHIDQLKRYSRLTLTSHKDHVHSVRWNPEGDILASGGKDRTICLHKVSEGRLIPDTKYFDGHTSDIDQVFWNPVDTFQLASSSIDKHIKIWDVRAGESVGSTRLRSESMTACWSSDGNTIVVADKADLVSFIDTRAGFKIVKDHKLQCEVGELVMNKEGDLLFMTSADGKVHILSYPDLQTLSVIDAFSSPCVCIRFDPTGKYFAIGSNDAIASIWDTENLACIQAIDRLDWAIKTVSFSHDSQYLASGSEDSFIDVADIHTGEQVATIDVGHPTLTLDFHPKDYILAYAVRADTRDYRDLGAIKISGMPEDKKRY